MCALRRHAWKCFCGLVWNLRLFMISARLVCVCGARNDNSRLFSIAQTASIIITQALIQFAMKKLDYCLLFVNNQSDFLANLLFVCLTKSYPSTKGRTSRQSVYDTRVKTYMANKQSPPRVNNSRDFQRQKNHELNIWSLLAMMW